MPVVQMPKLFLQADVKNKVTSEKYIKDRKDLDMFLNIAYVNAVLAGRKHKQFLDFGFCIVFINDEKYYLLQDTADLLRPLTFDYNKYDELLEADNLLDIIAYIMSNYY